jgi:hypothetical protein
MMVQAGEGIYRIIELYWYSLVDLWLYSEGAGIHVHKNRTL